MSKNHFSSLFWLFTATSSRSSTTPSCCSSSRSPPPAINWHQKGREEITTTYFPHHHLFHSRFISAVLPATPPHPNWNVYELCSSHQLRHPLLRLKFNSISNRTKSIRNRLMPSYHRSMVQLITASSSVKFSGKMHDFADMGCCGSIDISFI